LEETVALKSSEVEGGMDLFQGW